MADHSILMCFRLRREHLSNEEIEERLLSLGPMCIGPLSAAPTVVSGSQDPSDRIYVFVASNSRFCTLRRYVTGLVTVDIHHFLSESPFTEKLIRALENRVRNRMEPLISEINTTYCPIHRGLPVWSYAATTRGRILEMDYDTTLFDKTSKWQHIRINHSREHGNVLLLDDEVMLGESDFVYTSTLLQLDNEDYTDKTVLVLGGGDGAVLHELLKKKPKYVTMVEIDEEVIKACRTHMRSVCGSSLDHYEGSNYKVLIEDCLRVLKDSIKRKQRYDYIINDLTERPLDLDNCSKNRIIGDYDDSQITSRITELCVRAIQHDGKILARGDCLEATDNLQRFEADLFRMNCSHRRREVYIPSFREMYCLYEIQLRDDVKRPS